MESRWNILMMKTGVFHLRTQFSNEAVDMFSNKLKYAKEELLTLLIFVCLRSRLGIIY